MRTVPSLARHRIGIGLLTLVILGAASGNTYAGKENDWTHEHRADGSQEHGHSTGHWQSVYGRHAQYHRMHKEPVHANTKISPTKGKPNQPFTIIDTSGRRLVPESVAIFRLGDIEFEIPLKTHWPFNTAKGQVPVGAYNGTYDVVIRQPGGSEFHLGVFTIVGATEPPEHIAYDFNNAAQASEEIGPAGGLLNLDDGYGSVFKLEVPAGALAADTEISLTGVVSVSNFPPDFRVLKAVRLQPSGLTFDGSARLTIDLPESSRDGYPAVAFLSNDDGTRLTFLPLTGSDPIAAALSDPSVSLDLAHFSVAGVAESYGDGAFPPPLADATAEERAMAVIAARMAELLISGGDPFTDQQIIDALSDWFRNPVDGLLVRLEVASASPESLSIEGLRRLVAGEATRFLEQARYYLPATELQLPEADLREAVSELFESYRIELTSLACEQSTREAQLNLNALQPLIGEFDGGELEPDFADETFFCSYQVILDRLFEPVFIPGPPLEVFYEIRLPDQSYIGSLQELSTEFEIPEPRIVMENGSFVDTSSSFLIQPGQIGPASLTVQIADSPESRVDILWIPSFLGTYVIVGSGTASGCIDEFDAGAGGGVMEAVASSQTLLAATQTSARIQFTLAATTLTSFIATVDLTSIENGQASGSISGSLSYAYVEYDQGGYYVAGGGPFAGSITVAGTTRIANVSYAGSSNWCSSYVGTALMTGQ
ncbi:MAG: hypothetical protein AMJ53_10545 [Gammaproteobacteria bacterium SG8_11]|nr:MAG: hypothetical protein AMJ53_10545 [Gammaproteobacteria bacterium SG8_11]